MLARYGEVFAAYLCLMINQETQEQSLVIGVTFLPNKENVEIFDKVAYAVGQYIPEGLALDFMVVDGSNPGEIEGAVMEHGDCFFTGH